MSHSNNFQLLVSNMSIALPKLFAKVHLVSIQYPCLSYVNMNVKEFSGETLWNILLPELPQCCNLAAQLR